MQFSPPNWYVHLFARSKGAWDSLLSHPKISTQEAENVPSDEGGLCRAYEIKDRLIHYLRVLLMNSHHLLSLLQMILHNVPLPNHPTSPSMDIDVFLNGPDVKCLTLTKGRRSLH